MKTLVMLFLVLSIAFVGCAAEKNTSDKGSDIGQPEEVTEDQAVEDINSSLVPENDDVEIGEMI